MRLIFVELTSFSNNYMNALDSDLGYSDKLKYWDNSFRAKVIYVVFAIMAAVLLAGMVSSFFEIKLLEQMRAQGTIDESVASANDIRQLIMALLFLAAQLATAIVFLNWFRRSYENLLRLEVKTLTEPKSMILWNWFIPVLNWFKPFLMMKELWREMIIFSGPTEGTKQVNNPFLVPWWTLFIFTGFIGGVVLNISGRAESLDGLIIDSWLCVFFDAFQVIEAVVVILMIKKFAVLESEVKQKVEDSDGIVLQMD